MDNPRHVRVNSPSQAGIRGYRIGIDTGGTFTDIVALHEQSGEMLTTKISSTPDDPSRSLVEGVHKVLRGKSDPPTGIFHGTTVATNALLEERFSSLGLITTEGFRHILEIARQSVPDGYGNSYFWVKPERIVPLHRVKEVPERLDFRGDVVRALDEEEARRVARWFRDKRIQSIGVCLIHAYANGAHELRMREILAEEYPEAVVSLSSEVLPEYREYERAITTLVDAFVKPAVREYVQRAESRVRSLESDLPFLIMQSNGGVLSAAQVAAHPISTLLSGPAAGALGASMLAAQAGFSNVLTIDAGGTSTDICVVEGGEPHVTAEGMVGRFPVKVPMIDIITIGTGGGSIARVDASGGLRVGPTSAGALPGPMCYAKGGDQPTLTDANVVLGYLPPHLLGGEVPLDVERARFGLERLAHRLGMDATRLAAGIIEIADWNQVNAIRQVTVKKGLDPRDHAMVAFGGSGPLQVARVMHLLGMPTALVPPSPGNVSAFGLLAVDLRTDYVATIVQREDRFEPNAIERLLRRLETDAARDLSEEGIPTERRRFLWTADLRYLGQAYEVGVAMSRGTVTPQSLRGAVEAFHETHERLYGYSYRGAQLTEIVNLRVTGIGVIEKPQMAELSETKGEPLPIGIRDVYFEGSFSPCPIYSRNALGRGADIVGSAIIEEYGSTTVVRPGQHVTIDRYGNLLLAANPERKISP